MADKHQWAARVRDLNDAMRTGGPTRPSYNRWFLTPGVLALGPDAVTAIMASIQTFSAFENGNDPYGEHDFGSIPWKGQNVFWKIDYYDRSLEEASPDPAEESLTCRVLTIMLAMEY